MAKRNVYTHSIDLKTISVKNSSREEFRNRISEIPYLGYEVESMADGRKIVIAKPGGKKAARSGAPLKEDFVVFIYTPREQALWQITHKQILEDLQQKAGQDKDATVAILECLERVYHGAEPNGILGQATLTCPCGEAPEALLKAYKWIWGQEDVNYPNHKGRALSWEGHLLPLLDQLRAS